MTPSGAKAIAVPECPDLAAAGASIASAAISLIARPSSSLAPGYKVSAMATTVVNREHVGALVTDDNLSRWRCRFRPTVT